MPKVRVDGDERYPDYYICDYDWAKEIELSDDELVKVNLARKLYDEAQSILKKAYELSRD